MANKIMYKLYYLDEKLNKIEFFYTSLPKCIRHIQQYISESEVILDYELHREDNKFIYRIYEVNNDSTVSIVTIERMEIL